MFKGKRIVALLLTVILAMSCMSISAFALSSADLEKAGISCDNSGKFHSSSYPGIDRYLKTKSEMDSAGIDVSKAISIKVPNPSDPSATITCYVAPNDAGLVDAVISNSIREDVSANDVLEAGKDTINNIYDKSFLAPNVDGANTILAPLKPYISTVMGIVLTLVVSLMGVLTALDICYLAMPAFRNFLAGKVAEGGSSAMTKRNSSTGETELRFISDEAQWAVNKSTEAQTSPWGAYFKSRILSYVFLAVAIFLLMTGNISIIVDLALKLIGGLMSLLTNIANG